MSPVKGWPFEPAQLCESAVQVLAEIRVQEHPTVRSLSAAVGIQISTAFSHVRTLEELGYISYEGIGSHRRIRPLVTPKPFSIDEWDALKTAVVVL